MCVEGGKGWRVCTKTNTAINHLCIPFSHSLSPLSFSRGMLFSAVQQPELPLAMPTLLPLLCALLLPSLLLQPRLTLVSSEITSVFRLSFVPTRSGATI